MMFSPHTERLPVTSAGIAFGQATTDADDLLAYDLVGYVEMDDALLEDLNVRLPEYS